MISRLLFKTRTAKPKRLPAAVPAGVVVWAVGDIHGRLDLLDPLLDHMLQDLSRSSAERKVIVFLGDYIDRGPDSRGVLERLAELAENASIECRFIQGNHEERMLAFLDDPSVGPSWCEYGGTEALASFGLKPPAMAHKTQAWAPVAADLAHRLTKRQRALLDRLEASVSIGGYFFAHAGARPGVPLADQSDRDLMWIRGSFLDDPEPFEQIVVHGHTPSRDVHVDGRRIGVDTGVYKWDMLSAVRLEDERVQIAQAVMGDDGAPQMRTRDAKVPQPVAA